MAEPLTIEVWSDVVCPWCYIGKRRLTEAIASMPDLGDVDVVHRAFQLDPSATNTGERTVDHLASKYGVSTEEAMGMMDNVSQVAATVGLTYDLANTRHGNTRDAHRLLLWAQQQGNVDAVLERLYSGYFEQGESVFTEDDLLGVARDTGLDVEAARAMLESDALCDEVLADQQLAHDFGSRGVPFFVIDRRYGISGAQPLEVFVETLRQAAAAPVA